MSQEKTNASNRQRLEKLKEKFFSSLSLRGAEKDLGRLFVYQISTSLAELDYIGKETIQAFLPKVIKTLEPKDPGKNPLTVFNFTHREAPKTVVLMRHKDSPFLIDSISNYLRNQGYTIDFLMHPLLKVERAEKGEAIVSIESPDAETPKEEIESIILIVLSKGLDKDQITQLKSGLKRVTQNIAYAVSDWVQMREKCLETIENLTLGKRHFSEEDFSETQAFLKWIEQGNFTFLGVRDYVFQSPKAKLKDVLGIARDQKECFFHVNCLLGEQEDFLPAPDKPFFITKTIPRSLVHRNTPMDVVRVKLFDKNGGVIGEREFIGLFTSAAYTLSIKNIPILRKKLQAALTASDIFFPSYTGKALVHILETLPRDELFQFEEEDLISFAHQILQLQERKRVLLFVRPDPLNHLISCFVYVPTENYSGALREKIQGILESGLNAHMTSYHPSIDPDLPYARVLYSFAKNPFEKTAYQQKILQKQIELAAQSWKESFKRLLDQTPDKTVTHAYEKAFSADYQLDFTPLEAFEDARHCEQSAREKEVLVKICHMSPKTDKTLSYTLKIFSPHAIPLTDIMPIFEMMGLKVFSEETYKIAPEGKDIFHLHSFSVESAFPESISLDTFQSTVESGFQALARGQFENDFLNALMVQSGLLVGEIKILRAYFKYLKQIHFPYSLRLVTRVFTQNAALTQKIIGLFKEKFSLKASQAKVKKLMKEVEAEIELLSSQEEDRIFSSYLSLIQATLRTNYFKSPTPPYLIFKFDCTKIQNLPAPRPEREFFIHHQDFEATHLRTGLVARGGLRWSDRVEDFRTEILGLMKAQKVKNTIIVPVGAKGGFVIKKPFAGVGKEERLAFGIRCYKTMIQAMLDVTDNLVDGAPKSPENVTCYDDFDPYLVVAADKGTATFSDYANEISVKNGFWLGDAFASGGSNGYDHKKMGITAKGAWKSVQHHFQKLGHDVQSKPFTVVGVGDMSGDVFGNGMLCSDQIKLVAAFNHMHIFVDPTPDTASSFKERQRLFDRPGSQWTDYDAACLSEGGAIYSRADKTVTLSKEAQKALKINKSELSPNELIREILKAPVDLLWFGGIGTYVKETHETAQDVGDRANDAIRVTGAQLRCKVIGEGANLGMTQRARVEFALKGGILNTDAIDNSAGVDCSDHEVNIKILLKRIQETGALTEETRNTLLEHMTDNVSELVLKHNVAQNIALSLIQSRGISVLGRQERFMKFMERQGYLDRALEFLPDEEEIQRRLSSQAGLTRPELSVILAYGKLFAYDVILASSLPDVPYLQNKLIEYFPEALKDSYQELIKDHPLKREIIATVTCNELVNRQGPTYLPEVIGITQEEPVKVILNYFVARDSLGIPELNKQIQDLPIDFGVRQKILLDLVEVVDFSTLWLTFNKRKSKDVCSDIEIYQKNIQTLTQTLEAFLTPKEKKDLAKEKALLVKHKVPAELAQRVAAYRYMKYIWSITNICMRTGLSLERVAAVFYKINSAYHIQWLRKSCEKARTDDPWRKKNLRLIVRELDMVQERLAERILKETDSNQDVASLLKSWEQDNDASTQLYFKTIQELKVPRTVTVDMIAIGFNALMEFSKI